MEHLSDEGIEILGRKAAPGLCELNAYLDNISGVFARNFGDLVQSSLLHRPFQFASDLNTIYADLLLNVVRRGDIMDRLTACLRILQIPKSQVPADAPFDLMEAAQGHLSGILVDHPVLMHHRIMVKRHHFERSEFGPIATILAETPRAEFPRLSHGISPERLQAFARHPCVRVGLMQEAPNALREKNAKLQGRTLLNAVVVAHPITPRARMLGSILELDAARASKSNRVASLLTCKGETEVALQGCFANSFLAQCGFGHLLAPDLQQPAPDYLDAPRTSGVVHEPWFLPSIELRLQRWATVSAPAQPGALMAIARLHTPRVEPSARHLPGALAELQGGGSWDGLHIYPDAELGPDGHWQFSRISAGWEPKTGGYNVQCFENAASRSFFGVVQTRVPLSRATSRIDRPVRA